MNPDFTDRTYTVEVLRTASDPAEIIKAILKLTIGPHVREELKDEHSPDTTLIHGFIGNSRAYHRSVRTIHLADGSALEVPRQKNVRGLDLNLYDVIIGFSGRHVIIAVPFHDLAESFFVKVDQALAGTRTLYQKLDITRLVIKLGSKGEVVLPGTSKSTFSVTRCHLVYSDPESRTPPIQTLRMTGAHLGDSPQYRSLIKQVIKPLKNLKSVTPVVLGFALSVNDVKRCSATSDRHGNFKVWVAAGLRRLSRLLHMLEALEQLENVTSTTSNVPILQSKTIRDVED